MIRFSYVLGAGAMAAFVAAWLADMVGLEAQAASKAPVATGGVVSGPDSVAVASLE